MPSNYLVSYSVSLQNSILPPITAITGTVLFLFPLATIRFPLRRLGYPALLCCTAKVLKKRSFFPPSPGKTKYKAHRTEEKGNFIAR